MSDTEENEPIRVVVTDIDISIKQMVILFLKFLVALLILSVSISVPFLFWTFIINN